MISCSAVSAADDLTSDIISADDNNLILDENIQDVSSTNDNELILEENDDIVPASDVQSKPKLEEANGDVIGDSNTVDTASFEAIQDSVNSAGEGDTIYLKNQTYIGSGIEIVVEKSLTFIGNDTILDAQELSGIFNITEGVHNITFRNIKFTKGYGSLINSRSGNTNIINCSISDNVYYYNSNQVEINNSESNVTILDSVFENNSNPNEYDDGVLQILSKNTVIDNCIFNDNYNNKDYRVSSVMGFAITCFSENVVFRNSIITNNFDYLSGYGNTVAFQGSNINIFNCSFVNNSQRYKGNSSGYTGILEVGRYKDFQLEDDERWDTAVIDIDGCSFKNNNLEGANNMKGILNTNYRPMDNITIRNSVFENNIGDVAAYSNNTIIQNCSFKNMTPRSGSIYLSYGGISAVEDCTFENILGYGVCDYYWSVQGNKLFVTNCSFKNTVSGIYAYGEGSRSNGTLDVKDCTFINSTGSALSGNSLENIFIGNCSFINNTGENGSAINLKTWRNHTSIANCLFENNTASNYGGAIYTPDDAVNTNLMIDNCSFVNNTAKYGGAMYLSGDNTNITNSRFEKNVAIFSGGCIYVYEVEGKLYNGNVIENCEFVNNFASSTPTISSDTPNSCVRNCSFVNNTPIKLYSSGNPGRICSISGENSTVLDCRFINNTLMANVSSAISVGLIFGCENGMVANCIFENNAIIQNATESMHLATECALNVWRNNVTVENCSFVNNHIEANSEILLGGAMLISGETENITLRNCNFSNNFLNNRNESGNNWGGALLVNYACKNIDIMGCRFVNNSAIGNGSAGGAIAFYAVNNSSVINCVFEDNFATGGYSDRVGIVGGGAICYLMGWIDDGYQSQLDSFIINSTFKNNKASSTYLNITEENGIFKISLEGLEKYMHAIYTCGEYVDFMDVHFQNVTYWDGELLNTDLVAPVESTMASNQPIVFEFYNPKGQLVQNITKMTDSNGQLAFDYTELPDGVYTYKIYHPENSYYTYIYGGEGAFNLRTSFANLNEKIEQATDSITLQCDYIYNSTLDSEFSNGININKNLTIYGNGCFIDGNGQGRIFKVAEGVTLTLIDLSLRNADDGAIYNNGDLTVINSTLEGNYAIGSNSLGGAIYNNGILTIIGSTFKNNRAYAGGAIYNGEDKTATIINSTLNNNRARGGQDTGGAIYNYGNMSIIGSTLNDNNGHYDGGAIYNGAMANLSISNSTLANNTAENGGAIYNYYGTLTINDSLLEGNSADEGGVIYNIYNGTVNVNNSTFRNNTAPDASAIWTDKGENVILNDVKFVDQGDNPIYSESGVVDISETKTLTAVAFTIEDIANFISGSAITINVAETIKGTSFNGNVTVCIGNNNFTIEVLNGIGSKTVTPNLDFGDYIAKLHFAETDVYDCADAQSNVFHVMNEPAIKLSIANIQTGDSFTVKVNAIHTFNGAVNVVINGVNYVVNIVNGAGSKTISKNLNPGTYSATVDYAGNENFTADTASASFTVSKRTTAIAASAVKATYAVSKNLVATLKDKSGKAISGVKVTIKINGKTYTRTTDKKGQVKLAVGSLVPKTYTAAITFAGNSIYAKSTKSVKVKVKKATPKMTAKAKTFKVKVKVKKYTITLKNNKGKVMKNTKVTLKVNKKTFTAKTNKKGVATFKITNLKKKGKYTAVITYSGSKYYNKVTKKPKLTIKA